MSEANEATVNQDTFLQHVSLKNYKSIKDVEIDFRPGLNIIIGKNASGKTNFVNGLNSILNFNYNELLDSESYIKMFFSGEITKIEALNIEQTSGNFLKIDHFNTPINHKLSLTVSNEQIPVNEPIDLVHRLNDKQLHFNEVLVKYGLNYKQTSQFINLPFSFAIINNGKISQEMMTVTKSDNRTEFIQGFFSTLYVYILGLYTHRKPNIVVDKPDFSEIELKKMIITFSDEHFKITNELLVVYSPIKAIRINPDFNIIKENDQQKLSVTNFYLEFLIDKSWLTFNLLSDGTKRLFYIIAEMLATDYMDDVFLTYDVLKIFLLEEPELGIHPHQLHLLMQFIKEQSRYKQIILTTHSPQVLDTLEPDELDRIIICSNDPQNGTKLNHLTDKQISKAKKYMKEDFLSDYWRFSDLEPA